jgi:hypothetical protein
MKKILSLVAASMFAVNMFAQSEVADKDVNKTHGDKFCYIMKDGKLMVLHDGVELMTDYTTAKGVTVKPDGTIMRKDGTATMLKEGECVDSEGKLEKKGEKENKKY